MVVKLADHFPLYRQEKIFGRAGLAIARSTLEQWAGQIGVRLQPLVDALREAVLSQKVIHADEIQVQMLAPGENKTHRADVWAHSTKPFSALRAVVYDFSPSRAGEHARNFLSDWNGKLVCDDFTGYKVCFEQGITEIGCMAPMPVASFLICTWRTKVSWPNKRCTRLAVCTRSSAKRGT